MSSKHFIKNFMEEVSVEREFDNETSISVKQADLEPTIVGDDFYFEASGWYSNQYTTAKYIPGHRSRTNRWIPGRTRPGKQDRRKGK